MKTLGERLKSLRNNKGLSQSELADYINISTSNISRIENDEVSPSAKIVLQICNFFSVSTDWLLIGEDSNIKNESYENTDVDILTSDEYELIQHFRSLPNKEKYKTLGNLEAKAEIYAAKSKLQDTSQDTEFSSDFNIGKIQA